VTATRDRDSDLDIDSDSVEAAWDERPIVGRGRGLPWWAAVLLALALAAAGAIVDSSRLVDDQRLNALGIYHVAFLAGCVLAVLAVRRRNLFGPMVQPPLIFAVTFVPVQLMARTPSPNAESGSRKLLFEVALPLASSFPWMAGATAATILLGIVRLFMQRNPDTRLQRLDGEEDDAPPRRERPRRPESDERRRPPRDDRAAWDGGADRVDDRRDRRERDRPAKGPDRREPPRRRPSREEPDRDRGRDRDRGDRGREGRGRDGRGRDDRGRGEPPRRPRPQSGDGRGSQPPRRRPRDD
jgi:hypothetical protein